MLLQSGRAPHGNSAADPDQLAGLRVQDLFVLVVENLLADVHVVSSPALDKQDSAFTKSFSARPGPDKQDKYVNESVFCKKLRKQILTY